MRRYHWPSGLCQRGHLQPPTMKPLYSQGTAKKMGPGTLKDQLGSAGWVPHGGAEESGQNFPLTKGAQIKDELVSRGRRGSQVKGRYGGKGQALAARGAGPIHIPTADCATPAKPQSPHMPIGAKKLCLPGWIDPCTPLPSLPPGPH